MSFLNGARWLNGAIEGILSWNPTGTAKNISLPDKDGIVALTNDLRPKATSQPIYYVNPSTGSDTNNGLTTGTAFATIQKAIDVLAAIDGNGFAGQVVPAPGTYAAGATIPPMVGYTSVSIIAAASDTVFVQAPIVASNLQCPLILRRINFTPSAPASSLFAISADNVDLTIQQCGFSGGDSNFVHVSANNSSIRYVTSATVSGFFRSHLRGSNNTVYHSGLFSASLPCVFTTFFDIPDGAIVQGATIPANPTGTFTGLKFNALFVGIDVATIPGTGGIYGHNLMASADPAAARSAINYGDTVRLTAVANVSLTTGSQAEPTLINQTSLPNGWSITNGRILLPPGTYLINGQMFMEAAPGGAIASNATAWFFVRNPANNSLMTFSENPLIPFQNAAGNFAIGVLTFLYTSTSSFLLSIVGRQNFTGNTPSVIAEKTFVTIVRLF